MHGFVTYGLLGTRLKQNVENKLRGVEKALGIYPIVEVGKVIILEHSTCIYALTPYFRPSLK